MKNKLKKMGGLGGGGPWGGSMGGAYVKKFLSNFLLFEIERREVVE